MDLPERSATRRGRSLVSGPVMVSLLTAILVLLALIAFNTHRLVIEQQRSTCFARLAWLSPGLEDRPAGVDRSSSARLCEGNSPLIEYQDGD